MVPWLPWLGVALAGEAAGAGAPAAESAPGEEAPPPDATEAPPADGAPPVETPPAQPAPQEPAPEPERPKLDTSAATPLEDLTPREVKRFEPRHYLLPQNPRGQTDYTAYTLEWGEFEVGTYLTAGVLPSFQVGTILLADVLGVYNVEAKLNAVRIGPFDLAANGSYYYLGRPEITGQFWSAGGTMSLILLPPWSIHVGGWYSVLDATGQVPRDFLAGVLSSFVGAEIEGSSVPEVEAHLGVKTGTAMIATDVRFNRRDSMVLQARALLWSSTDFEFGTAEDPTLLSNEHAEGWTDLSQSYVASLSYQATFRNFDVRLGVGWPILNPAWLMQGVELSYRFGGKTRLSERRMEKTFERNLRDAKRAKPAEPAPPATP